MSRVAAILKKPVVLLSAILPLALISEFILLEGALGISLPSDRGSALSTYEIREQGTALHFVTRNKRFFIADLWRHHGSVAKNLILRESIVTDRQQGVEGTRSTVTVAAFDGSAAMWSFEEPGEHGQVLDQVYEVTKVGCCGAPNTYTYFALRDGKKLRSAHSRLNQAELAALMGLAYD
jgi:hypothetical protein